MATRSAPGSKGSRRPIDALHVVRRRLHQQRLTGNYFDRPDEVVAWLGAVQAQEFAEAQWSLAERTKKCTAADVDAAFDNGAIVRTHVLRPTWHFVHRQDLRWMLRLTKPRVHALNKYWYKRFGIEPRVVTKSHRVLVKMIREKQAATRKELATALSVASIEASGPQMGYLLMLAELEELICSGPRRGKQHTYMLLDDRCPTHARDSISAEAAADELVFRYFRSHGPATVKDFTAWSSLTVATTQASLERLEGKLSVEVDGDGKRWFSEPRRATNRPYATKKAFLIPTYDETIVAYQDLRVVLPHEPEGEGQLSRAIVINGLTVGNWSRTLSRAQVKVNATLFGPLDPGQTTALNNVAQRFGKFLGLTAEIQTRTIRSTTSSRSTHSPFGTNPSES